MLLCLSYWFLTELYMNLYRLYFSLLPALVAYSLPSQLINSILAGNERALILTDIYLFRNKDCNSIPVLKEASASRFTPDISVQAPSFRAAID